MLARMRAVAGALVQIEIWPLVALYLASSFVEGLLPLMVAVAVLFWLLRLLAQRQLTARTPADGPMALMVLMVPVTLWATAYPQETVPQVTLLLANIALYYALVNWATDARRLRLGVAALATVGLGLALGAPVTVTWHANKVFLIPSSFYARFSVLVGEGIHPNDMAAAAAPLFVALLGIAVYAWSRMSAGERLLTGGAAVSLLALLLLSQSRGALLGAGAALVLMAALRWRWGWLALPPLGIGGGLALRAFGLQALEVVTAPSGPGGPASRPEIWSAALCAIQDFPLTGIGMGAFGEVIPALYPLFSGYLPQDHAHNVFLQVAVDLGIPGLVAWLAIVALAMVSAWELHSQASERGDRWAAGLGAGLLCSQVALGVHGMVDVAAWRTPLGGMVWALWGLAMAGRNACGASCAPPEAERSHVEKG